MKESLYTIPLMDAFNADDECPFCFIERELEQHAIAFILGSAYMEDDIRMETDETGFCRHHFKMMYDYGNRLGSALILSTHFKKLNKDLKEQIKTFAPGKTSIFKKNKTTESPLIDWLEKNERSCYVCNYIENHYERYLDTFFYLYKNNPEFMEIFKNCKGFCLHHFKELAAECQSKLNDKQKAEFYPLIFSLMEENLKRLEEEVTWFTDKYDYRNKDKDWGNSKDSVQRCMQKSSGGYPADKIFTADK